MILGTNVPSSVRTKNPLWYFVFAYPRAIGPHLSNRLMATDDLSGLVFLNDGGPYEVDRYEENPPPDGMVNIDFYPFQDTLPQYLLPLKFKREDNLLENGKLSNEGFNKYTYVEMTEYEINVQFLERAFEYLEQGEFESFLDFHFSNYAYDLNKWLDNFNAILNRLDDYFKNIVHPKNTIPTLKILLLKQSGMHWIKKKRELLPELYGEQPAAAAVEETELTSLEITAVAHKVILFHELGVIEFLKKLCMSKNPTLSDTQFANLLAGMMGFQGTQIETVRKALSGYGQRGKSDVRSRAALDKVKSGLMKFGIEL